MSGHHSISSQNQIFSQNVDFEKLSIKTSENTFLPFPKMPDPLILAQKSELVNKCMIPDCKNQRLVFKGMTYPVCGRKCWTLWQNQPKEAPFWT